MGELGQARPPRLLIVSTVYNMIRDFLLPYAAHYRDLGWQVDALAQRDDTYDECAASFDRAWEIGWSRHPGELRNIPGQLRQVRRLVEDEGYDLVHVHTPIAGFLARMALRGRHRPPGTSVLYTAHGFHFRPGGGRAANLAFLGAERLAGRWTDHLIVINRIDEGAALRHHLVPPDRVHYMPGIGIDTGRYVPEHVSAAEVAAFRAEIGLGAGERLYLMIAEFTFNKRHRDVVQAFSRLERPGAHLAIAGRDGPALEPTRELVERLGLGDRVHFLGFRDDVPVMIRASTGVLLVSGREGLPRSVLESMCLARPVIGTRIRGITELLEGAGGILVEVGDVAAIRQAVRLLDDDPVRARALGELGRLHSRTFDLRATLALHDELYALALGARVPA